MTKKHRKKEKSIIFKLLLVLLIVVALCVGAIVLVINLTGNEKKMNVPMVQPTITPISEEKEEQPSEEPTETAPTQTEKAEKTQTEAPKNNVAVLPKITTSSVKAPIKTETTTLYYKTENMTDNNKETAWSPKETDEAPTIKLSSSSKQAVTGFKIENGYSKNENLYQQNRRGKDILITVDDDEFEYTLKDLGCGVPQIVYLPEKTETTKLEIKFLSYYEGSKYNDLCITELEPF